MKSKYVYTYLFVLVYFCIWGVGNIMNLDCHQSGSNWGDHCQHRVSVTEMKTEISTFVDYIPCAGKPSGNCGLFFCLGWPKFRYWKIRQCKTLSCFYLLLICNLDIAVSHFWHLNNVIWTLGCRMRKFSRSNECFVCYEICWCGIIYVFYGHRKQIEV